MARGIQLCPPEPLLAVRGVSWGALHDEPAQILVESGRGGKIPHAERQKNPTPGMRRLGRVLSELLADLTVDLVSEQIHHNYTIHADLTKVVIRWNFLNLQVYILTSAHFRGQKSIKPFFSR